MRISVFTVNGSMRVSRFKSIGTNNIRRAYKITPGSCIFSRMFFILARMTDMRKTCRKRFSFPMF